MYHVGDGSNNQIALAKNVMSMSNEAMAMYVPYPYSNQFNKHTLPKKCTQCVICAQCLAAQNVKQSSGNVSNHWRFKHAFFTPTESLYRHI